MSLDERRWRLLLLGRILLLIGLLLSLSDAEFVEALVGTGFPQRLVRRELGLILSDSARRLGLNDFRHWNDSLGNQLRRDVHLLLGSITLVGLGKLLGEEDEFGSVLLQTLNVLLKGFHALVAATVIDGDADGPGEVLVKTGGFDLLEGESTTKPLLLVVLNRWASHNGPELGSGPGSNLGREHFSGVLSADLPGRLVEPRLHAVLPILLKMRILNNVVMFGSHSLR